MQVTDVLGLFIDETIQKVEIFDTEKECAVYNGYISDMPTDLLYSEISTIDNIVKGSDVFVINI